MDKQRLGVIGTGVMARAMARRISDLGFAIVFGSADNHRAERVASTFDGDATGGPYRQAVEQTDLVLLATDWQRVEGALEQAGPFAGEIIIDCTNPQPPGSVDLIADLEASGAELVARWAPGARVVKAFNSIYAVALDEPRFYGLPATIWYCGDEADAKRRVSSLIRSLGFDGIDAGPLEVARYLEPMGALMSRLVRKQGWPAPDVAFRFLRRGSRPGQESDPAAPCATKTPEHASCGKQGTKIAGRGERI